jgi:lipid II:glycine glycyltransferase (peptidoglycan interpeptide bridge formation enzyme)
MTRRFTVCRNKEIDPVKWDNLTGSSDYTTPFQTRQYYEFINSGTENSAYAVAIENNTGQYQASCIVSVQREKGMKSFFSRRAIIYGGPVMVENCERKALQLLLQTLHADLRHKVIYTEVRNYKDYNKYSEIYKSLNWKYLPYLNIKVGLNYGTLPELISTFKYNRRREIRLSIDAGIKYRIAADVKEINDLYKILNDLYNQKVKLPLPSLQYFIDFWKSGLMKIFIVTDGEEIVGGSFCVINDDAIFTYYYCGKNYIHKVFPTHLAILAAMEYGISNKLKYLDFMGAGVANVTYGVRKYKLGFGGTLNEEGRFLKINNKVLYNLGVLTINLISKR